MYSHPHQYLYNTVHVLIHKTYMVRLSLKRGLGFFNLRLFFCVCECWIYLSVFTLWTRLSWPDTPRSAQTIGETDPNAWCSVEEPPRQETLSCTSSSHVSLCPNYHSNTLDVLFYLLFMQSIAIMWKRKELDPRLKHSSIHGEEKNLVGGGTSNPCAVGKEAEGG